MKLMGGVFAAVAALVCCLGAQAEDRSWIDPFNVGLDIRAICDFHDGAPMSESCHTLIAAVVEIEKADRGLGDETAKRLNLACIPAGLSVEQIFAAIRPDLRRSVGLCAGLCSSTGYVRTSLNAAFPCPLGKQ